MYRGRSAYLEKGRGTGLYSNLENVDTFFNGIFARKFVGKTLLSRNSGGA